MRIDRDPEVSVIIPVFNTELHLKACLDSVIEQSFRDFEIICVDDCSTDGSPSILEDIASQEPRLRIIRHTANQGASAARNSGMEVARGRWIFHVDSDDSLPPHAIALLHSEGSRNDSELVKGGFSNYCKGVGLVDVDWSMPAEKLVNTNVYESGFLATIPSSHCSYLYRRELLHAKGLKYPTNLIIGEDLVFLASVIVAARKVTLLTEVVYHYHEVDVSATRGHLSCQAHKDSILAEEQVETLLRDAGLSHAAQQRLQYWTYQIHELWLPMTSSLSVAECGEIFETFRQVIFRANIRPWNARTRLRYRYVLALVLNGMDRETIEFLRSDEYENDLSEPAEQEKAVDFLLSNFPNDAGTLFCLGLLQQDRGQVEEAMRSYRQSIALDARQIRPRTRIAKLLASQALFEQARQEFDNALGFAIDLGANARVVENIQRARRNVDKLEVARHNEATNRKPTKISSLTKAAMRRFKLTERKKKR